MSFGEDVLAEAEMDLGLSGGLRRQPHDDPEPAYQAALYLREMGLSPHGLVAPYGSACDVRKRALLQGYCGAVWAVLPLVSDPITESSEPSLIEVEMCPIERDPWTGKRPMRWLLYRSHPRGGHPAAAVPLTHYVTINTVEIPNWVRPTLKRPGQPRRSISRWEAARDHERALSSR